MLRQRCFVAGRALVRRAFHDLPARDLKQLEDLFAVQKPPRATRGTKGAYTKAARTLRIEQHLDLACPIQTLETLVAAGLPKRSPIKSDDSDLLRDSTVFVFFDHTWFLEVHPSYGIRCDVSDKRVDLCNLVGGYFEHCRKLEIYEAKDWAFEEGYALGDYERLSPRNPLWEGEENEEYDYDDGLDLQDLCVLPPEDGPMYLSDGVWLHSGGRLSHSPQGPDKH